MTDNKIFTILSLTAFYEYEIIVIINVIFRRWATIERKYPVYASFGHGYLRLVLLLLPCLCVYLASQTGADFLYTVAIISALIGICVIHALSASVTFRVEGLFAKVGLKRKIFLNWDSILCCGIFSIRMMGDIQKQRYIFFSSQPVNINELEKSQIMPKLTETFVYISYRKDVYETVSKLWNSEKAKLVR